MDAPRTSIVRRLFASHLTPVASAAAAASVAALMVLTMTASDATAREAGLASGSADVHGPPPPASLGALLGMPPGVAFVDADGIADAVRFADVARFGEAVRAQEIARFAEALAAVPRPAAPGPAVEAAPQAHAAPAAPPPAPVEPPPAPVEPPAAPPPAPVVAAGLDTSPMDSYEQALFDATNVRRAANGLAPLRPNGYLVGVARIRSQEMATHDYFSHTSPVTGDNAFSLMDSYGIAYGYAGENLAMNNYPSAECVGVADQALFDSQAHRENLLHPHYTDMGIGHAVTAEGMHYFTVIFTGPA